MKFWNRVHPKLGDKRTKKSFAWLPTTVGIKPSSNRNKPDETTIVWLETYITHLEFKGGYYEEESEWVVTDRVAIYKEVDGTVSN